MIREQLTDRIPPRLQKLVKVPQKKMRDDIHLSVLELDNVDLALIERRAEAVENHVFSSLYVDLEKIDPLNASFLHVFIAATDRANDVIVAAMMRISEMGGVFVRSIKVVHGDRASPIRQTEIVGDQSRISDRAFPQNGVGTFNDFERMEFDLR